ncbi:family 43 glycosylhydrolase [Aeoliella sp.]|uniref:family 43 glycosylhydrolase n=1 Tax=Aeoliella sp. TaxID=2795800 RepID=UPI003CCC3A80
MQQPTQQLLQGMLALGFAAFGGSVFAENPFVTSIYTADPSAHVWADGRLYVYASHDIDPPRGCDLMDRYHVFSTDDMVNWRDEGEILNSGQVPWGRPEGGFMWAPDCAYRNGKYYFYFPHPSESDWNNSWKIGVAISSQPATGFSEAGFIPGIGGFGMIDPSVFIDDDGQPYIYYGGAAKCEGGKLKDNMVEIDGATRKMEGLVDFHEAAWVFKRNGIYYMTYSDNLQGANRLRYATSSHPLGPWEHKGIYLAPTGCDTSHGSVVEFKGQWYQFYHNVAISGQGNLRSMCVDRLEFNEDGTIREVIQTKAGPPALSPSSHLSQTTEHYAITNATVGKGATVVEGQQASDGYAVHNLHLPDSFIEFTQVDGGEMGGRAYVEVAYAANEDAKLRLQVNDDDLSFINAVSTGGWDAYSGRTGLTVTLKPGRSNRVRFTGGNDGVNIAWFRVSRLQRPNE